MKIGEFLKTTKGKAVAIGGGTVVAVGIVLAVLLQGGGYRSILVEQVEGTANVVGERNNGPAYSGERLYSGDDVSVLEASSLTMCMDNDKYVYADANTHFSLEASSAKEDSRIRIVLDKGSELNVLKSKLGSKDSYEVDTPNSTMSVRGTIFRVTVYTGDDGLVYTLLEVKEGLVFVKLKTQDGTFNGVEREFKAGESALIRGNFDFSEFVQGDEGAVERHLDYEALPEDSVERLIALLVLEGVIEDADLDMNADSSLETEGSNSDWKGGEETLTPKGSTTEEEDTVNNSEEKKITEKAENKTTDTNNKSEDKKTSTGKTSSSGSNKKTDKNTSTSTNKDEPTEQTASQSNTSATQTVTDKNTSANQTAEKKTETAATAEKKTEEEKTEEEKTEHVHTPGGWEVVNAATCTTAGSRQKKCTSCGEVVETEAINATGHDWGRWEVTKAADCTNAGSKKRTCNNCGHTETVRVNALGHNWVTVQSQSGTAAGEVTICSRCGINK